MFGFLVVSALLGAFFAWHFWKENERKRELDSIFRIFYIPLLKAKRVSGEDYDKEMKAFKSYVSHVFGEDKVIETLNICEERYQKLKGTLGDIESGPYRSLPD